MTAISNERQDRQIEQALTAVYGLLLNLARENRAKQAERQPIAEPGAETAPNTEQHEG